MGKLYFALIFFVFIWGGSVFSQATDFGKIEAMLSSMNADSVSVALKKIDTSYISTYEKGLWHFYTSKAFLSKDNYGKAFENALRAKLHFKAVDSLEDCFQTNLLMLGITGHQEKLDFDEEPILNELKAYAEQKNDPASSARVYAKVGGKYLFLDNAEKSLYFYDRSISDYKKASKPFGVAYIELNKGTVHMLLTQNLDSALYFYKKALPIFEERDYKQGISFAHNNMAEVYKRQKKYDQALEHYKLANDVELNKNGASTRLLYYENLTDLYEKMGDYKNAYEYSIKTKKLSDSLDNTAQNIAISEIQTKYETEKKEKENLQLKTEVEKKSRAQKILWGGLGLSLTIGALISFLVFKNAQKKRKLARQEQQLELQRVEKTLKEQELHTIDNMIAGQEKERQRLANDLHDNLGSTLATLKLNFKSLQRDFDKKEAKPVLENAALLIDEAYKKTREIAHEKNSGVMAKEGLLPAVKGMAKKISAAKGVQVEVQDFGLEKRLDNTVEIAVFRIIQELTTNIVKHAHATEATISLTNHEDLLNIIVEDNGKGFNSKKAMRNDGMGLANIEKRVEHMDGSMEIDSSKNVGTSVIIDLPI
jgi:signal transduction histidine kinase